MEIKEEEEKASILKFVVCGVTAGMHTKLVALTVCARDPLGFPRILY